MIKKIIQIADIHIPNSDKNQPYERMIKKFLQQLYTNEIEDKNTDEIRIVICGDIFESKVNVSNEALTVFNHLLNFCNQFCPTYIIAGNHDLLVNNLDRVDSISPIFEVTNIYPNIRFLDKELNYKSGYIEDDNVVWNLYSIFDNYSSTNIEHSQYPDKKIIGLYHGDIVGSVTDTGYVSDFGFSGNEFLENDCVMAGHIHKFQTIKKEGVPIVYSGSLFQHNAGENVSGHGYVVWDLETMKYELKEVENDYRIFKFKISDYDAFENDVEQVINL